MIEKKLAEHISGFLNVEPTDSQNVAIQQIASFLFDTNQNSLFLLKGYAGTGKTLLVSSLVNALKQFRIDTILLAPTGRAAKVLASYAGKNAYTIHKKIYRKHASADIQGFFEIDFNKASQTLFIVDEASMISNSVAEGSIFGTGRLLEDLIEYVYNGRNCRLMLVGDVAQLPPVGLAISQALDVNQLETLDKKVYQATLTDVVRQTQESGILYNATLLRLNLKSRMTNQYFKIKLEGFPDIKSIGGDELIEALQTCYDRYGQDETIVVTRSNKRANKFNEGIRGSILWHEAELVHGDLIMVVKNNYHWVDPENGLEFIANGDIAKVIRVGRYEEMYGFRFANVTLELLDYNMEIDCKLFLDTLTIEKPSFGAEESQRLYEAIQEDYADIKSKRKRWEKIKEDPYFNALQIKYAYAVTCHKAQGGQWDAVFVDHGYLTEDMLTIDTLRWFYTAFTRPRKMLYLVNFDKKFFNLEE